jgi:hypothetical protein
MKHAIGYTYRWKPIKAAPALDIGSLLHKVLQAHYERIRLAQRAGEKIDAAALYAAVSELLYNRETGKQTEYQELVEWMYRGYVDCYGTDEQWEILEVEKKYELWLPTATGGRSQFKIKGTVDLVVRDREIGGIWVTDHKAEPVTNLIHTPTGPRTMGSLQVGDRVIGSDGKATQIISVFPQGMTRIVQVEFVDGGMVKCSDDHLWTVTRGGGETPKIIKTSELAANIQNGKRHVFVPFTKPVQYTGTPPLMRLDPYLLGVLLGDGSYARATPTVHTHKSDLDYFRLAVHQRLRGGDSVSKNRRRTENGYAFGITGGSTTAALKELGIHGQKHSGKTVPREYLTDSIETRYELLRGLMDTDGCIDSRKGTGDTARTRFVTTSPYLADAVIWLARSLGGQASVSSRYPNQKPNTSLAYMIYVWTPECPFRLPRKAKKWEKHHSNRLGRRVRSVTLCAPEEAQCIQVEAADGLYVTGGSDGSAFAVTHNTCKNLPKGRETDLDDQFGLYPWMMRRPKIAGTKIGRGYGMKKVELLPDGGFNIRGAYHNAIRKEKLKTREMAHEERFKRTLTVRTDVEMDKMALEILETFRDVYRQAREADKAGHLPPRTPDSERCGWKCSFTEACLLSRKGLDIHSLLAESGYEQDWTRH